MKVPFLDLRIKDCEVRKEYLDAIEDVMLHGQFVIGPEVELFEKTVAEILNAKYAIAVSSGTDALILALRVLDIGIGDEVIIPAMSFVATANAVALLGAIPRLADIDDDFNISTDSIKKLINKKTKAIMPVHYAGKIANMEVINLIAKEHNLKVIEDASQAFCATRNNEYAGTIGDIGCISLNPMKILGGIGEAGIIITKKKDIYERLKTLRYNGLKNRSECVEISSNCKPDTIVCAVLLKQLNKIDKIIKKRRDIAEYYRSSLSKYIECPKDDNNCKDVYYTFTCKSNNENRGNLHNYLTTQGIESKIYHTVISDEPVYSNNKDVVENAKKLYKEKLALPCNENITDEQLEYIVNKTINFFKDK